MLSAIQQTTTLPSQSNAHSSHQHFPTIFAFGFLHTAVFINLPLFFALYATTTRPIRTHTGLQVMARATVDSHFIANNLFSLLLQLRVRKTAENIKKIGLVALICNFGCYESSNLSREFHSALNMQKMSPCKFARTTDEGVLFAFDEIYCILIVQYIRNFIFERRLKVCGLLGD